MAPSRRVCIIQKVSQGVNNSKLDLTARAMETFQIESCVRGHHIYKDIWNSSSGEELNYSREIENTKDPFSVVVKRRTIVGHGMINLKSAWDYIKIASRAGKDKISPKLNLAV